MTSRVDQILKPCPFCGSKNGLNLHGSIDSGYHIDCGGCKLRMTNHYSQEFMIRKWNERRSPKPIGGMGR